VYFFGNLKYICFSKYNKNDFIICDVLIPSLAFSSLLAAKIRKVKCVAIFTDLPKYILSSRISFSTKIRVILLNKFDAYVFLTEFMASKINDNKKPYLVIEGHVDNKMKLSTNDLQLKDTKKIILYSGGVDESDGIEYMIKGFEKAKIDNAELHIYGKGDFTKKLLNICRLNQNIKYFGVEKNDIVVERQIRATLLVNPRPSEQEFTKYSFPSKNMEYMVSGTPILTTVLPGMPNDYFPYIYPILDESIDGISRDFSYILNLSKYELHEKGYIAKEYVLKNKSNDIQAQRILELVKRTKH